MYSNPTDMLAAAIVTHAIKQAQPQPAPAGTPPGAPAAPPATLPSLTFTWTLRFALIDLAGGPSLPHIRQLTRAHRATLNFNFLAYLLGPFYYLHLGLWRKALTLTTLSALAITAATAAGIPLIYTAGLAPSLFALRANVDFYKARMFGDRAWW